MFDSAFGMFPTGFGMFGVMFTVVFVLILGVILITLVRSIGQWSKNNHSPRLTVVLTIWDILRLRLLTM